METMYRASWNDLRRHPTPRWFQDAKFGIYTHWGIYSVPARGPNATWYPFNMYREGTEQYEYHLKTYGGPRKFGYKDFIPQFTGERFDPDEWAELFRQAGARYAGPVAEHHDGFAMWDTHYSVWNAARMGPKRDVVGELSRAIRQQGLRFLTAFHHAENWYFFPHWRKDFDTADPRYADLYGDAHDINGVPDPLPWQHDWWQQERPSQAFLERWRGKIDEVIDHYQPDMLWFDFGLDYIQEQVKLAMLAGYYNKAHQRGQEVVVTYKWNHLVPGAGVIDLELGRFDSLTYMDWVTDTTVDAGQGWGYLSETGYKTPQSLIHYLIDNVSKNGYLLLNVGPRPDGTIPEPAQELLREIGRWLEVNGEAIYGTTPWMVYGEGPTEMPKAGPFMEDAEVHYTGQDIRFTTKEDALYAICLGWPAETVLIKTAHRLYPSEIQSVRLLGVDRDLQWSLSPEGLRVTRPPEKPCEHAFVFKIQRRPPFA